MSTNSRVLSLICQQGEFDSIIKIKKVESLFVATHLFAELSKTIKKSLDQQKLSSPYKKGVESQLKSRGVNSNYSFHLSTQIF